MTRIEWNGLEIEVDWDALNGQWCFGSITMKDPVVWGEYVYENGLLGEHPDHEEYVKDYPELWEDEYDKATKDRDDAILSCIDRTPEDLDD